MATSDSAKDIEKKSDLLSDEVGGEVTTQEGTFGFDVKKPETDLTLLVEDKKIYVIRVILETISSSFKKVISEQLLNGEENNVRIDGKTFEDFIEFLACVYPGNMKEVTRNNVYKVLPLAFEYGVDFLKRRCESVLIGEMSKVSVDEDFISKCGNIAIRYNLLSLKQKSLATVVSRRLDEINTLDKKPLLDAEGRLVVYESLLPSLRSEASRNRYISAGYKCENTPFDFKSFTDANYKKLDLQIDVKSNKPVCYKVVLWNRGHKLDVKTVRYSDPNMLRNNGGHSDALVLTLSVDHEKSSSSFSVAFKVFVKNYDPLCPEGDICCQECKVINGVKKSSSDSLSLSLSMGYLQRMQYRMNGKYTITAHVLMNNPKYS